MQHDSAAISQFLILNSQLNKIFLPFFCVLIQYPLDALADCDVIVLIQIGKGSTHAPFRSVEAAAVQKYQRGFLSKAEYYVQRTVRLLEVFNELVSIELFGPDQHVDFRIVAHP